LVSAIRSIAAYPPAYRPCGNWVRMLQRYEDELRLPSVRLSVHCAMKVELNVPKKETPLGSSDAFTPTRRPRYAFVATVKATDVVSGMQLVGLTTDLSEGG